MKVLVIELLSVVPKPNPGGDVVRVTMAVTTIAATFYMADAADGQQTQQPSRDTCYDSSILSPSPFMGNHGEVFRLADGSIWEVQNEYEYMYEYYPAVVACPSRGMLLLAGKRLSVLPLAAPPSESQPASQQSTPQVIESRIDGEFSGWDGETIFKLENGQVLQQSSYAYRYRYAYRPRVLIYKPGPTYKMRVDGVDAEISVVRLR